jgi:hypothetical protein
LNLQLPIYNKSDCHDIIEIVLKVALNTIKQTKPKLKGEGQDDVIKKEVNDM